MFTLQDSELSPLIQKINDLYITYRKKYVMSIPGGSMFTPKKGDDQYCLLNDAAILRHLQQKYAVAIFAGPYSSKFICFDVDDGQADTVHKVVDQQTNLTIPRDRVYVSYSGGKGYHVEVFFDQLIYTNILQGLYEMVLEGAELSRCQVEFRPTSGAAIKLPLSIHAKTRKVCWYVDRETQEPIERLDYLLEIEKVSAEKVIAIVPSERTVHPPKQIARKAKPSAPKPDESVSPDLLEEVGTRHNRMRSIAVYLRQIGRSREQCHEGLVAWYDKQDKALIHSDTETVMADVADILDWVFSEKFKLTPRPEVREIWLCETDARHVIQAANRTQRRVLFLLLVRSMVGQKGISLERIGQITGVSKRSVSKAIKVLESSGVLRHHPGRTHKTPEGYYVNSCNHYEVPHHAGTRHEERQAFTVQGIEQEFDQAYQRFLSLAGGQNIHKYLTHAEIMEYMQADNIAPLDDLLRVGENCEERVLSHEKYGEMVVYVRDGFYFYPIADVLSCMGKKDPSKCAYRYSSKPIEIIQRNGKRVKKRYIDEETLKGILERSRCEYKQELLTWLLRWRVNDAK